jgi:hypothetical protein
MSRSCDVEVWEIPFSVCQYGDHKVGLIASKSTLVTFERKGWLVVTVQLDAVRKHTYAPGFHPLRSSRTTASLVSSIRADSSIDSQGKALEAVPTKNPVKRKLRGGHAHLHRPNS